MTNEPLGMLKTDNLLSGYPFNYRIINYPDNYPGTKMASFPVNDFTEGAWKSNKIIKIIMGPGVADSIKSRKHNQW